MINVHASLLPRYRGAAPVHRAVMAGERETGVTIMRVVKALDAGPMLARRERAIDPDETSDAVERDLARIGGALLIDAIDDPRPDARTRRPRRRGEHARAASDQGRRAHRLDSLGG
jgi:methionyl-tRNA formyltransferase